MRDKIIEELKKIEIEQNIRILYAVESGSRGWGFESKDSDYDVRFIYIHPVDWYLSIDTKRDVIEYPITDLLDINGWDLRKALNLFSKSNPSLLEWFNSPIVYRKQYDTIEKMKRLLPEFFSEKTAIYHYINMASGNYREYLQGEKVKIKKYFYVLRPVFACMWIEKYKTEPPMVFEELLSSLNIDSLLLEEIKKLLKRKRAGEEMDLEPKVEKINEFLEKKINYYKEYVKEIKNKEFKEKHILNQLFRESLVEIWNENHPQ